MFTLEHVVPWGRSFDEYQRMFALSAADLGGRIVCCGDGPASFNAEAARLGWRVVSCDPLYLWDARQIHERIMATYNRMMDETRRNADEFVWGRTIRSVEHLGQLRMRAMERFLEHFASGKTAGRYVAAALPSLPFSDGAFGLALCSHFLFLYSDQLSEAFHHAALKEMCRVADEVRIFPLLALGSRPSPFVDSCVADLTAAGFTTSIEKVHYEFQRGGNQMLRVRRQLHK